LQEEQKFLQQRVETLQKELEVYADRSRHEMEQLKAELNSTQEVSKSALLGVANRHCHLRLLAILSCL